MGERQASRSKRAPAQNKGTAKPSHQERMRYQGKMLDEIMRWKRDELSKRQAELSITDLRALAVTAPEPVDFAAALRQPGVSLIAEVKRASPSRGLLCRDFDPVRLAQTYAQGGAAAISVLTDSRFFQGELEHLTAVKETVAEFGRQGERASGQAGDWETGRKREKVQGQAGDERGHEGPPEGMSSPRPIPVLRKDFIFDPYQIVEARVAGADALLLIVAVLGDNELRHLLGETHRYGMQALVEVHDETEAARALSAGAQVIGVNNRDLRTFAVDLATTERLRRLIPSDRLLVSESGIHTSEDVRRLATMGVDAMLVGESLVVAPAQQRLAKVRELVRAGRNK